MIFIIMKIVIFLLLSLSCVGITYFFRTSGLIGKSLQHAYETLDEAAVERTRNAKRDMILQNENKGFWERVLEHPGKRFVYSRLGYLVQGLTFELWLVLKVAAGALLYFGCLVVSKSVWSSLAVIAVYSLLLVGAEYLLAWKNYKSVDDNMLKLVNLMSNFSVTSGEITSIFHQISKYMQEPLGSVLEECYYDAQTSGNTSVALFAMAEKIEHPMFKEFIRNIEICINYTASFTVIINNARKLIMAEQRSKKERRAIANDNLVEMVIISIALLIALVLADSLIETSIWQILFETVVGHVGLGIVGVFYLVFFGSLATAEK